MSWDSLSADIIACIWRERFIIMSTNALTNLLKTDEELPFNANVDVNLVHCIHNQLHKYSYFICDKQLSQLYAFLNNFMYDTNSDSDTDSLSESVHNYSQFVLGEIHHRN